MTKTKAFTIRDRDGADLHEGQSVSLARLVETLVASGVSLARADLRRRDLSGLNLDGAILDDALLDGCDLRRTSAVRASFVGASMRGVSAQGLDAEHGQFQGVDLGPDPDVELRHGAHEEGSHGVPSNLDGARLGFSNLSGAILDDAILDHANMSRCSLARVTAKRASLRAVTMSDTDFSYGTFVRCDFGHSKLLPSTRLPSRTLPDRTYRTTAIGCSYEGAALDGTTSAFRRDRAWTAIRGVMATTVAAGTLVAAMRHFHVEGEGLFDGLLQEGPTLVLATTAAVVLKDMLTERLRDFMADRASDVDTRVRRFVKSGLRGVENAAAVAVAMLHGPGRKAVLSAIVATRRMTVPEASAEGLWFDDNLDARAGTTVVFVDRFHLARALEIVSSGKTRHRLNGDVVLVRDDSTSPDVPSVVRYGRGGGTALAWTSDGAVVGTAAYDRAGNLVGSDGPERDRRINGYMRGFGRAILATHGVDLRYDDENHEIRAGRDGSILVLHRDSKRPDNPLDAALVTLTGRRHFREGSERFPEPDLSHVRGDAAPAVGL